MPRIIELNISDYARVDETSFQRESEYTDLSENDDENEIEYERENRLRNIRPREPETINYTANVGWGFCDDNGKVWKVRFYYGRVPNRTYITIKGMVNDD